MGRENKLAVGSQYAKAEIGKAEIGKWGHSPTTRKGGKARRHPSHGSFSLKDELARTDKPGTSLAAKKRSGEIFIYTVMEVTFCSFNTILMDRYKMCQ